MSRNVKHCQTLLWLHINISELKVRSYQSSYFGIKQSRSEAKQSKVKQKPSKSEAKHRFEQKLLDLGCSCSPHVFDLSTFQIWTSQNLYQFCRPRPVRTDHWSFQTSLDREREVRESLILIIVMQSEAKHRFEQKLLDLGCSCSPYVFDLSTFQIWTS